MLVVRNEHGLYCAPESPEEAQERIRQEAARALRAMAGPTKPKVRGKAKAKAKGKGTSPVSGDYIVVSNGELASSIQRRRPANFIWFVFRAERALLHRTCYGPVGARGEEGRLPKSI